MPDKTKPAAKISIYPVHAVIWKNGKFYSTDFERSYKDGEQWKRTRSFDHYNLLTLAKVVDMAHTEIERLKAQDRQDEANEHRPELNGETADE